MANGTTSFDRTNYFEVVASSELGTGVWLESDRMAFLLDTIDEKKLSIQRDVVSNERRQSYENRPYGVGFLRTCDLLYPSPHPYYECVIGSIPEIQAANVDDLKAFFRTFYGPQNASLALVGDFNPAEAKALIEKYFGPIPRGPEVPRPSAAAAPIASVVKETVEDKVAELPRVDVIWNGIKPYSDDEAAGDVLATILGNGRTSRLYKSLVHDKQVASDIDSGNEAIGLGGWFSVGATVKDGHQVGELLPLLDKEVEAIKHSGVTQAEVDRAVRRFVASKVRAVERLGGFGGKADILNEYEMWKGDPGFIGKDLARYRAVTPEAVKAFANKYLPADRRIELTLVPAAGKGAADSKVSK